MNRGVAIKITINVIACCVLVWEYKPILNHVDLSFSLYAQFVFNARAKSIDQSVEFHDTGEWAYFISWSMLVPETVHDFIITLQTDHRKCCGLLHALMDGVTKQPNLSAFTLILDTNSCIAEV
jgi:hypothetical protein